MLLALSLVLAVVAAAAAAPPSSAPAAPLRLPRSDPSEQLQHDLNAAIAAGSSSFAISPGVYRPKGDLFLNNARDLSVASGSGGLVALVFRCNWGIVLRSCVNVSVANVTIDYDPPCYSQGVVTHIDKQTIRYTVDDGFPTPTRDSDQRFVTAPIVKVIRWDPLTTLRVGKTLKLAYNTSQRVIR